MQLSKLIVIALALLIDMSACVRPRVPSDTQHTFADAIEDARLAERDEISQDLIALVDTEPRIRWCEEDQERVLVVTWQTDRTFRDYYGDAGFIGTTAADERYAVWVTAVPEVSDFCRAVNLSDAALSLRLKQYLGANPRRPYKWFIELCVSPDDLFRPCPDPETTDHQCDLRPTRTEEIPGIPSYEEYLANVSKRSYRVDGAPWTRLGYTYDWGNPESEIGASEFVIRPSAPFEVRRALPTEDYCAPDVPQD